MKELFRIDLFILIIFVIIFISLEKKTMILKNGHSILENMS